MAQNYTIKALIIASNISPLSTALDAQKKGQSKNATISWKTLLLYCFDVAEKNVGLS